MESKLSSAEEAVLGALNEEVSSRLTSAVPASSPASTQILRRRLIDIRHSVEVRHVELEAAVEMSRKFDDKLHDVSDRLDEIDRDTENLCQLPAPAEVDIQQHISEQKVPCQY